MLDRDLPGLAGWIAGRAQAPRGDFIINGVIIVDCVEGCAALIGGRDIGMYREGEGRPTYRYGPCRGTDRCRATFHGFLEK
jgi:hypothetical protein